MRKFTRDINAATPTYEYIILIGIIVVYLALFLALYSDQIEIAPSRVAMQTQFEDVGNSISSKVVDMYLTAPETGYLKTRFYIPPGVGKYEYKVEFKEDGLDQQILVSAVRFEKEAMITLNKIGSSLVLNGSTYSPQAEHWLTHSMSAQYDLSTAGVVYPQEVVYNLTSSPPSSDLVTFDAGDSKGVGILRFTWDFGDGTAGNNATEYHRYLSQGIYNATLTVYDPILHKSGSLSFKVNVTSLTIKPGLEAFKYFSPNSFKVGNPSTLSIFLYGKGTPSDSPSPDIILTTDISGSMDPDTYSGQYDNGFTSFNKTKGVMQSLNWSQTFAVDVSFTNLSIVAKSVNGSPNKDINLWIKYPNGTIIRANIAIPDGEQFIDKAPAIGNWNLFITGNFTNGTQDFKVIVNKSTIGSGYAANTTVAEYSDTISSNAYVMNVTAEDRLSNFKVELTNLNGTRKLQMWVNKTSLINAEARYEDTNVPAGTNYTIYVTPDFPEGSQEFELNLSMAKLDAAKISGKSFTDFLVSTDKSGLVTFANNVANLVQPLTYNKTAVRNSIDGLTAGGNTPGGDGLKKAREELIMNSTYFTAGDKTRLPVIIFMSDGIPNVPSPESAGMAYALQQANITKSMGILIYTIGFGKDANMSLLANVSSGEGFYFYAANKEQLQQIYSQIAKELREIAARNLVITDIIPAGIDVTSVSGDCNVTKNADGTTTIQWKVDRVKIISEGKTPVVLQVGITTLNSGLRDGNVFGLSNVTYTNTTGNDITLVFPQTKIDAWQTGGGQMNLE